MVFLLLNGLSLLAQPYGLDQAQPIGPYLNNVFPATAPSASASWNVEVAFTNISIDQPMFMLPFPGTNRLVILRKPGVIATFPNRRDVNQSEILTFLDISSRVFTTSDSGLTGMAFHPQFGQPGSINRGYVYITYKWRPASVGTSNPDYSYWRLSRFTVPDGQIVADPNSEVVLVQQFDRQEFHDAGCLLFSSDGFLYFSIGDEGGANDEYNSTQTFTERMMSGIFRIDVNQNPSLSHAIRRQPLHHPAMPSGWPESFTTNYFVPNDNPFVNPNGSLLEEYYALGFRQPYRFSRDPVTGLIWVGESGQSTREEVDILVPGANYQWAYREGSVAGPKSPPAITNGFEKAPLWDYGRDQGGCIIGGYVYRGVEHAAFLTGKYIWVDNVSGRIWAITSDGTTLTNVEFLTSMPSGSVYGGTSSCALDAQGEIYFLKFGGDGAQRIYKLSRTTTIIPDPPVLLSQVGAFSNLTTLLPASGLHPYTVNTPLWSDGAAKQRWVAVPNDGTHNTASEKITFSATNEWQFPSGTVFVKHFELPASDTNSGSSYRLETRFIVRDQNNGVYGVTYKWRADGSDADLLTNSATQDYLINTATGVRTQHWTFPNRLDCLTCHNSNAKGVLGVKTHQLNCDNYYPVTGRTDNQLRALGHIGIFTTNYSEAQIPTYPRAYNITNNTQSLETRVRSYIDANCSQCHRPGGQRANFDARYTIPLDQQNLIYGAVFDAVNGPEDRVVRPQDLLHSMMHNRASRVSALQMPPLAKNIVDTNAMSLFASWINSLPTGPGVTLSITNSAELISGPFAVSVQFTEPVNGVQPSHFIASNAKVTGISGAGQNYTIMVTPQVKGAVYLQYAANPITGATGQKNYPSNPLFVTYDPLNQYLSTWLPLEEGAGTSTADASAHGNNGALYNLTPSQWTSGIIGGALAFDGFDDYVEISNHLGASFTIACWVKTTQTFPQADNTYEGTGIIWADVGGPANDFVLGGTRSAVGVDRLSFFVGGTETSVHGNQEISSGQWTHLAVTRNGASGAINLYVNGVLDNSGTGSTTVLNANPTIHIGGNTLDGRYFNGLIDDVRFYSRVLNQAEIASLMPSTPPAVTLTTASSTVTNRFTVTATFTEVVSALTSDDIVVTNGIAGAVSGNGGAYSFVVTPSAPGAVTIRVPAGRVLDGDGNGNTASPNLVVTASDSAVSSIGLVDNWPFDESSGNTAFDISGSGNDGAMVNMNNFNRTGGVWGRALFFNGTNSYVTVSNNLGSDFSLSLWIKSTQPFQVTGNTFEGTGIIWSDVGGTANDFILGGTRSATGTNRLSLFTGNPDSSLNGTKEICSGRWTHLAVVRRRATGERRIFVNGALDGVSFGGTNILTANNTIRIGGNTLDNRYFQGLIDQVRAYNRALSDAEVAALAYAGGYQSWAASLPAGSLGRSADPDGDGQPNLLEYAFGTNPLAQNGSAFTIIRAPDSSVWLSYPRRTDFSGLQYTVLKSDDLTNWSPVPDGDLFKTTQPVPGQPLETVFAQIVALTPGGFYRLQVTTAQN